jgi:hypothetical protein
MPAPTAATPGRKKSSGSPGKSRRRPRAGAGKASARPRPASRRLWPIAAVAAVVFLASYILDVGAVGRLMWACLTGQLGTQARIASIGVLLLSAGALAWASRRPAPRRVTKAPRKARPRPTRSRQKPARTEPEEAPTSDGMRPAEPG